MSDIKLISQKSQFRLNDVIWFYPDFYDHAAFLCVEMFQGLILEVFHTHHGVYYKIYLTGTSTIIDYVQEKNIFINKRECFKNILEQIRF